MTLIRYNQQPSYLKHRRYLKFFDQLKISEGWQKGRKKRQAGMRGKPCPWSLWRARTESSRSRWPQTSSGCPRAQKGGADSSSHSSPLAHLPLPLRQSCKLPSVHVLNTGWDVSADKFKGLMDERLQRPHRAKRCRLYVIIPAGLWAKQ